MHKDNDISLIAIISIKQYLSFENIENLLAKFLKEQNNKNIHYQIENNKEDEQIIIKFEDTDEALEYSKMLIYENSINSVNEKMKVIITFEGKVNNKTILKTESYNSLRTNKTKCNYSQRYLTINGKTRVYQIKNTYQPLLPCTPYRDEYTESKKEKSLNKSKWVYSRNFNAFIGIASTRRNNYIPNYVIREPSLPPLQFSSKLRELKKFQWVNPKGFY